MAAIALTAGITTAAAQPSGLITGAYGFSPEDILNYSRTAGTFSTARSAAMGGAFTSLGGDLVSIGLNPAGLGMYRTSTWGFSPSVTYANMDSRYNDIYASNGRTRFAPNNIGMVFNIRQQSSGLVSFSMGMSYNKAADYNYRGGYALPQGQWSIADIFNQQLNGLNYHLDGKGWVSIPNDWIGNNSNPWGNENIYLDEWGAVMGYQTGMFNAINVNNPNGEKTTRYHNTAIGDGVAISPSMFYESGGSMREWNISGGMNFDNVFYLGFGVTFQDIYHAQKIQYMEEFDYSGSGSSPEGSYLKTLHYNQYVRASGAGVNFKLGVIARPIPGLRIGAAVHSPTIASIQHSYQGDMRSKYYSAKSESKRSTAENEWSYPYTTPTHLMFGISYTFGNVAVISADYERIFYNGMRLRDKDLNGYETNEAYKREIQTVYRATNNFKAGLEVKPFVRLALRAGYSFYDSPVRPEYDTATDRFTLTTSHNISAGIGFRAGVNTTIDFAYIFSMNNYSDIVPFYYSGDYIDVASDGSYATDVKTVWTDHDFSDIKQKRHTFTLSFNFLF